MNTKNYKCLCDIEEEIENGTITQEIETTLNDTTVSYDIIRDLKEGGNISEINNHFDNLPYLEDGKVKYDDDLSILQSLFNPNYIEFDIGEHIDQIIWDMDVGEEKTIGITYTDNEFNTETYHVTIKLVSNTLEQTEEE
jgi:hypothetical protein